MNHFESTYKAPDGVELYLQAWMPDHPKASLLLVHGLGEHSGRYSVLAENLVSIGVSVFTFDGRGHGRSAPNGPDAYFDSYLSYLEDIHALFEKAKNYQQSLPIFIYGHSMGGGFAAAYVLKYNPTLSGVILSSPAIMEDPKTPKILKSISGLISRFFPRLKALKLDPKGISKLKKEVQRYLDDPLVYKDAYPARTATEVFNMMKYIQEKASEFDQPVLLLHGTSDTLTNPEGSKLLFKKSNSIDKTLRLIPGGYHELINDTDSELVLQIIVNWLKEKI